LAVEAVLKVNEAEKKGNDAINDAALTAREIIQNAEAEGLRKRNEIIGNAVGIKDEIIQAARVKALKECERLAVQSVTRVNEFGNPGSQKLDRAVQIIVERIVNAT